MRQGVSPTILSLREKTDMVTWVTIKIHVLKGLDAKCEEKTALFCPSIKQ
jgi:hypothetical protein